MKKPEDMTPQEITQELNELEVLVATKHVRISDLRRRQAIRACPYHVGQILTNRKGDRARIDDIFPLLHSGYAMRGVCLNAGGTPIRNVTTDKVKVYDCHFSESEEWKPI